MMKVLVAPFTANNPYQASLIAGLQRQGAEVLTRSAVETLPLFASACDVLHLHWLHPYYRGGFVVSRLARLALFVLSVLLVRISGRVVVWTVHNLRAHETEHPGLDALITRFVVRFANGYIVHCEWAKQQLLERYPHVNPGRIAVIPHGNYLDAYGEMPSAEQARDRLALPKTGRVFLFFGFIRPYKGVEELLQAFKTISTDHENLSLIVAGKPATSELRREIETLAGAAENIHLRLDYVDAKDVSVLFAAADFFVLPYRHIVTSGAAVLGMSLRKAVIAPRLGCMPETLGENGAILFDPEQKGALLQSLVDAVQLRDRQLAMGERNYAKVQDWGWDTIAEQSLALFQRLIPKRRTRL